MADGSAPALPSANKLTFPADTAFQRDLRDRVDGYFAQNNLSRAADRAMWLKAAFWLVFSPAVFLSAFFAPVSPLASIAIWTLGGFCLAFVK